MSHVFGPENASLTVQDEANGRGVQGRARPADRGDVVVGDARPGRGPGAHADGRLALAARARGDRRHPGARRRRQGGHRADDRRGGPRWGRRSSSARPPSRARRVEGELELAGERHPISFELAAGEDGRLAGTRDRQAERLGDEAVLGAVRDAQGRGRGRGGVDEPHAASRGRRSARRARPPHPAAARPCRGRTGRGRRSSARPRRRPHATNAPFSHVRLSGAAPSATPASSCALSRILPAALTTAASVPADGLVLKP